MRLGPLRAMSHKRLTFAQYVREEHVSPANWCDDCYGDVRMLVSRSPPADRSVRYGTAVLIIC